MGCLSRLLKRPFKFFEVVVQTLRVDLMERTDDRTLKQAPHTLNAVRMHVAHNRTVPRSG